MRTKTSTRWATLLAAALVTGCAAEGEVSGPEGTMAVEVQPLDQIFEAAAQEFDVPADLLKAVGYAETGWEMAEGEQEFDGLPAAFGVMGLRGDNLARGAALAGVDEDDARYDATANIRAAAALLSAWADEGGIVRTDVGAWAPVVARLSGATDAAGQYDYVVNNVYRAIQEGTTLELEGGLVLARVRRDEVTPNLQPPDETVAPQAAGPDYGPAIWRPSPNYGARPSGTKVNMVIIHTCEGSYSACWSWLRNTAAGASAHYVVSTGSEISQLVREASRAWHVAASYNCNLNGKVDCGKNGVSVNNFSIGIEHAGFASQKTFPNAQLEASAKLTCDITRDRGIPRDRNHIVGHGQLQPYNRTDPGKNWPWAHYIDRVRAHCGANTPPPAPTPTPPPPGGAALVVDSNQSKNDPAKAKVEVSSTWQSSNSTPGFYGTGYYWASTEAVSDGATFSFYLPAAATRTVDAWWTAGANRSSATPFVVFDAAGTKLGAVNKDQRANGSQWVTLGTYNFKAGWNKVVVSRWTGAAGVVVADAIRVR
jgi:N-acetyl-anhydromuramyl-L-alanine amidase AmpD